MKKEFKTFLCANMASSTLPVLLLLALTHREQDGKQTSPPTHFKIGFLKSTRSSRPYALHCTLSNVGTRTIIQDKNYVGTGNQVHDTKAGHACVQSNVQVRKQIMIVRDHSHIVALLFFSLDLELSGVNYRYSVVK